MVTTNGLTRLFFTSWLLLGGLFAKAQVLLTPPSLTNGQGAVSAFNRLKAGAYRYTMGGVRITVRFRLTETGELDTVRVIAEDDVDLPVAYLADMAQSLRSLHGQWTPQRRNGVAEKSYWLVAHYYLIREGAISPAMQATSAAYRAQYNQELVSGVRAKTTRSAIRTDRRLLAGCRDLVVCALCVYVGQLLDGGPASLTIEYASIHLSGQRAFTRELKGG